MSMTAIALKNLSKSFDQTSVLEDINIDVNDGEFLVVVGPSGCGKSTVLRLLAGLEEPTEGDIQFEGCSIVGVSPKDRDVAMVFQNYALYPHMTVYDNMAFGLKMRKTPKPEIEQLVSEAAEILELTPLLKRKPKQLSGGQRQRVALGRAIVRQPKAFLMDEPLSNLDAKLRVGMRREITELHNRLKVTTIYVTHDQDEAMTMGSRIAVLNDGVLQQCATPKQIYEEPSNLFVAGFMGQFNHFSVDINNGHQGDIAGLALNFGAISPKGSMIVGFRPEDAMMANASNSDEGLCLSGKVITSEYLGSHSRLKLLVFGDQQFLIDFPPNVQTDEGQLIEFVVPVSKLHYFSAGSLQRI